MKFLKNYLIILISAILSSFFIFLLIRGAYPTPFSDEFYFFNLYQSALSGSLDPMEIIRPHFGHIYIVLKLLLWTTIKFHLDWRINMYLGAAFLVGSSALILFVTLKRNQNLLSILFSIAAAVLICSGRQYENIFWAMQNVFGISLFSTIAAFIFAENFYTKKDVKYAIYATLFSFIALVSNGAGIITFILTNFSLLLSERRLKKYNPTVYISLLLGSALYFWINYNHPAQGQMSTVSQLNFFTLLKYILAFLSNGIYSFTALGDDTLSLFLGLIILVVSTWLILITRKDFHKNLFPLLMIAYGLSSALIIGLARLRAGIYQPNAPRYYPFAVCVVVGCLIILSRFKLRTMFEKILSIFFLILVLFSYLLSCINIWNISPYIYANNKFSHGHLCAGEKNGLAFFGQIQYTNLEIMREVFCTKEEIISANTKRLSIIKLISTGPESTKRRTSFNAQPNGESAIWAITENADSSCYLVFNNHKLKSFVKEDGSLITAAVPDKLYSEPGTYKINVECSLGNKKTSASIFTVE